MYTMKETCEKIGVSYETLKFYCKEGLVPNVRRDKNNHRLFDERNIAWLEGLLSLRKCGMGIKQIKQYMIYCLEGSYTIPDRKKMLNETKEELLQRLKELNEAIHFINQKQKFYDDIMIGKMEYNSNLILVEQNNLKPFKQ